MNNGLVIAGERCVSVGSACRDQKWKAQLVKNVTGLIFKAAQYCGQVMSMEDAAIHAGFYVEDLAKYFPGLDTVEVKQIFDLGVRDEFGEYYGLNARTFYRWTQKYVESETSRQRQLAKEKMIVEVSRREPTPAEWEAEVAENINKAYRRYLEQAPVEAPAAGTIGGQLRRMGYNPDDPLCDLGRGRESWLNAHGFQGTLKEIFDTAKAAGKRELLDPPILQKVG